MRSFLDSIGRCFSWLIKCQNLGYSCAGLMIAPAAAVVSLYPMNWILGVESFNIPPINAEQIGRFLIVPLAMGAAIALFNKNLMLAVMLLPGLLFMVSVPAEIGTVSKAPNSYDFFPTDYDLELIKKRIVRLDKGFARGGYIFSALGMEVPVETPIIPKVVNGPSPRTEIVTDRFVLDVIKNELASADLQKKK